MSDPLARFADSALGRSVLEKLGVPVPVALPRVATAWSVEPVRNKRVHVGGLGQEAELCSRLGALGAVAIGRGEKNIF